MAEEWGADTQGAEAQTTANLNAKQFTPLAVSRKKGESVNPEITDRMTANHVASYDAATPEQHSAGMHFYPRAHRAAVTVAKGEEPGVIPAGQAQTKAMKRGVYRPPGLTDAHVQNAAARIAILSPSSPAGMDWEHNAQAAYEVGNMKPAAAKSVHEAAAALHGSQIEAGRLRGLKGQPKAVVNEQQRTADAATDYSHQLSEQSRTHLGGMALNHAGVSAISRAHNVATGKVSPTDAVPQEQKTGAFMQNIADPAKSMRATVDFRSHDIGYGADLPTKQSRGLSGTARYAVHEKSIQDAATMRGVKPHQLQATEWLADKDMKLEGQSAGNLSMGRGKSRHEDTGKPVGQQGMPKAW